MSQQEDHPKRRHLLLLSGLPRSSLGRGGPGRARGAPLGDVLTARERALLRAPTASRPAEREEPSPPRGDPRALELLEAHQRHVAEIRARTQQLEQQREQLCQRLALLCNKHPSPELSQAPEVLLDKTGHRHQGAALHFDALLPPVGPLAAEARALRLSYLRAGGHDEATLARLLDFQLEATALEKRAVEKMSKHQPQHRAQGQDPVAAEAARGLDAALLAVELENQRLESELLALKVRREMRADAGSLAARQHTEELAQLQAKVEMLLRRQAEGMRPCLPSAVLPPPVAPPLPPALALAEPLRPTLRTGSPAAPSHLLAPSSLPSIPFGALDDPPPGQEAPAQHKHPQRHLPRYI
ncbi:coiled-coil domain-containing protein 17 isoform X4 [Numida meleagris]|nr:coiled-coil domain-containing protein 17 isoform X4 [Numida meleagris]XP_021261276.1 coiled-coil domain-containing protein 17 isoform X4 [Numida meleagris]